MFLEMIAANMTASLIIFFLFTFAFAVLEYGENSRSSYNRVPLFLLTVLVLGFVVYGFKIPVFEFISSRPETILHVLVIYLWLGLMWSFFRWKLFVRRIGREYRQLKEEFKNTNTNNRYFIYDKLSYRFKVPIDVSEHKTRITNWMMFWPWSAFWFIFGEMIILKYYKIFEFFKKIYQGMADKEFK